MESKTINFNSGVLLLINHLNNSKLVHKENKEENQESPILWKLELEKVILNYEPHSESHTKYEIDYSNSSRVCGIVVNAENSEINGILSTVFTIDDGTGLIRCIHRNEDPNKTLNKSLQNNGSIGISKNIASDEIRWSDLKKENTAYKILNYQKRFGKITDIVGKVAEVYGSMIESKDFGNGNRDKNKNDTKFIIIENISIGTDYEKMWVRTIESYDLYSSVYFNGLLSEYEVSEKAYMNSSSYERMMDSSNNSCETEDSALENSHS
ncbi:hypothetical protein BB559_005333 [Furculomyces boomerangus]|uniref:OB domain-containing protein n=1 Tax=Furculomyces boomerangus TaxID=61424 RepID=A0A2T9Y958_9FUNG|nr:hypothetical protein BB559_005685 [Furculomyces boomerangus]PVU88878.1 hypothetical protein BB559_005333 [Furculomyces boomerangus]